ncbi:MAG: hypothetical protein AAFP83_14145 [Bacteroidota bacterium]
MSFQEKYYHINSTKYFLAVRLNHIVQINKNQMINLAEVTDQQLNQMSADIAKISGELSEEELFEVIGNGLHDLRLETGIIDEMVVLQPKGYNGNLDKFNMSAAVRHVQDRNPLSKEEAKEEGKKFWGRFKEQLRLAICQDTKIKELIEGKGALKDYLLIGIPLVVATLGLTALNPVHLAIITTVFALILKVGFKAYCQIE